MQSLQAARPQTDDKYKVALQRLGTDKYSLVNLLTQLIVENSVDASDLCSDEISPQYQEGVPVVKVKGSLKSNITFWEHIGASRFVRDTIVDGYIRSPLFTLHPQRAFAIIDLPFSIANLWGKLFPIFL